MQHGDVHALIQRRTACSQQKAGLRVAEVPSHELDRRSGESKLNARRDGLRVLRTMMRGRRTPPRPVVPHYEPGFEEAG